MRIQPLSGKSPYAAYLSALQNGAGNHAASANDQSLGLAIPAVKGELISRIKRYEALQGKADDVLKALGSAPPQATSNGALETLTTQQVQLSQASKTAAVLTGDRVTLASSGSTDFGSMALNGTTTTLGLFTGASAAEAARFIVDKLNANAQNNFKATVGGEQNDQITLTSQGTGSSSQLTVESTVSAATGFTTGMNARGSDGTTDLGKVSINGITTTFGTVDNHQHTAASAAQYMAIRVNQTAGTEVQATVSGANKDQLTLTARLSGQAGHFAITGASSSSDESATNDGSNGFVPGMVSTPPENALPSDFRAPLLLLDQLATLPQALSPAPLRIPDTLKPATTSVPLKSATSEAAAASTFVLNANYYLSALEQERKRGLTGVKSFETEFMNALLAHKSELTALGVTVVGKGLQLDPDLLTDPANFKPSMDSLKQALEPVLTRQRSAMGEVVKYADSLDAVANQISQATVNMHRLSAQSSRLSSMVRFLGQRQGSLDEQTDILQRQQWTLSGSTGDNRVTGETVPTASSAPQSPL